MIIEIGITIICLLLLLLWLYFEAPVKHGKCLTKSIPGPPTIPVFGNILDIQKEKKGLMEYLSNQYKKYGHIFKIQLIGRLMIVITDPKDIEIILKSNEFIEKPHAISGYVEPWLGKGLLFCKGSEWRESRKLITPTFHFNILEKFYEVFNTNGDILLKILNKKTDKNIDIFQFLQLFALDVICETAMGISINAQTQTTENLYVEAVKELEKIVSLRSRELRYQFPFIFSRTQLGRDWVKHLKIVKNTSYNVIKTRRDQILMEKKDGFCKKRMAFLDLILQARHSNGEPLSNKEISDEVDTFMVAGHDTTSTQMSFLLYLIADRPDIQAEIFQEQIKILGEKRNPTFNECQGMHYLERCIKESQRLLGSVVLFSREMTEDLPLHTHGAIASKGSTLSIFLFELHRNPEIWPEPEKFDPDRFLPENIRARSPYAFLPFSAGPRNCIGQKFAMLEMKSCISKIIQNYKIAPAYDGNGHKFKPELRFRSLLTSINGIQIRLEPRK